MPIKLSPRLHTRMQTSMAREYDAALSANRSASSIGIGVNDKTGDLYYTSVRHHPATFTKYETSSRDQRRIVTRQEMGNAAKDVMSEKKRKLELLVAKTEG